MLTLADAGVLSFIYQNAGIEAITTMQDFLVDNIKAVVAMVVAIVVFLSAVTLAIWGLGLATGDKYRPYNDPNLEWDSENFEWKNK